MPCDAESCGKLMESGVNHIMIGFSDDLKD